MASWGFSNAPSIGGNIRAEADLDDFETEDLGLPVVETQAGTYLKLFPEAWPSDQLPPPTASLLSIASSKGILAAAGPNSLVIIGTEALRKQYIPERLKKDESNNLQEDEPKVKPLVPQASIQVPRVSHVAFSADDSCLVIVAEQGGGLAVYDTNQLSSDAKPAFQLGTNGTSVRHLLPNPSPAADLAHFFGIVLTNGQLLLADLKERKIVATASGSPVFHEKVCCAAWSKLGKHIIAGLEDGTAAQIDRSGVVKDAIPQPPQLSQIRQDLYASAAALPITSIAWLSTNEFFVIYSPVNPPSDEDLGPTDDSTYFYVLREPKQGWVFRKFSVDPCMAMVTHRARPAGHYIQKLNEWSPNLKDLLFVASSAATDIGIFTNFKNPDNLLSTTIGDESRRPTIPVGANDEDTTPVGLAIDLSARELPSRPIPSQVDAFENAPTPVPAFCLLNTEGVLSMRWIIYNDSIRQNTPYPGITHKTGPFITYDSFANAQPATPIQANAQDQPSMSITDTASQQPQASTPKLSAPASLFGSPGPSAFGSNPQQQSAFGKPAFGVSSFGGASAMGQAKSPWGNAAGSASASPAPAFGRSSFGSPTAVSGSGSAFGQVGGLGANKSSPWGTSAPSQPATPQLPQNGSAFGNTAAKSPFAAFSSGGTTTPSAFGSFAANNNSSQPSGFASIGQSPQQNLSPFSGQSTQTSIFGNRSSNLTKETSMGSTATLGSTGSSFSFGQPSGQATPSANSASFLSKPSMSKEATMENDSTGQNKQQAGGLTGLGGGFKLGSLFKGDGTAKDDLPKPKDPGAGLFGANFGSALGTVQEKKPDQPSSVIKQEPETEKKPDLLSVPAFKPPQTAQTSTPSKEEKEAEVIPEAAPLPPAWSFSKPTPTDLPGMPSIPSLTSDNKRKELENDPPLAGSPPVDLGHEKFSSAGGSENNGPEEASDEEDWGSDDDEEGDSGPGEESEEGEGEEESADEEEEVLPHVVQDPQALSAFQSRLRPPQPKDATSQSLSTTPPSSAKISFTPAGHPPNLRGGPIFPPPAAEPLRSPSPARGGFRSVTSPVGKVSAGPFPAQIKQTTVPPAPLVQRQALPAKPPEPTIDQLEDEADARVKAQLSAPIEPDKSLPLFYAHQDYAGTAERPGIGGQIDRVYRDINSMIDVLGLNARSLSTFVEGHIQMAKPGQRTRDDLEDEDAWTINEMGSLSGIIRQLDEQLESGRLEGAGDTIRELKDDEKEVVKMKAKANEIRKLVAARTDPEQLALQEAAPLPAETLAQQSELRQGVQKVQKLLIEAEQKMTVLRAELASLSAVEDPSKASRTRVPTVEAVTRTIQRMTSMVQERSGDIDLLESQIRQLPNGLAGIDLSADYEDDLVSRLGGHRLLTASTSGSPSRRSTRMAANGDPLGMSAMFGVSVSASPPPSITRRPRSAMFSPEASLLGRSTGSLSGSARKRMMDVTDQEIKEYDDKVGRRRAVLEALKERLEKKGPRVVKIE